MPVVGHEIKGSSGMRERSAKSLGQTLSVGKSIEAIHGSLSKGWIGKRSGAYSTRDARRRRRSANEGGFERRRDVGFGVTHTDLDN